MKAAGSRAGACNLLLGASTFPRGEINFLRAIYFHVIAEGIELCYIKQFRRRRVV